MVRLITVEDERDGRRVADVRPATRAAAAGRHTDHAGDAARAARPCDCAGRAAQGTAARRQGAAGTTEASHLLSHAQEPSKETVH